jgi:hypothetical protein
VVGCSGDSSAAGDSTPRRDSCDGTARCGFSSATGGRQLSLDFQNENLVARDSERGIVASVPDLITVLDAETGDPITTEGLQYGHRVRVIGMPCSPKWRTDRGLELVGPTYFDYDIDYEPIEHLQNSKEDH